MCNVRPRLVAVLLLSVMFVAMLPDTVLVAGTPAIDDTAVADRFLSTEFVSTGTFADDAVIARRSSQLIGADLLRTRVETSGRDVIVAIVDTGVDVEHTDITTVSTRQQRIVDWLDVSGEGDVKTATPVNLTSKWVHTPIGYADLRDVKSKSGRVYYGLLSEQQLDVDGRIQQDLDRNGRSDDVFLVIAADPNVAGYYDTVYIDVDGNLHLSDDEAMGEFRETGCVGWFGSPGTYRPATSFVISRVSKDGSLVSIGFDGNGHGTHVAGIIAANRGSTGGINGIAPGVRLLVIKALGSSGRGSWDQVSDGIEAAASMGADIISVSITALDKGAGLDNEFLRRVSRENNTLIVLAAGNNGPGMGTISVQTDPGSTLVVGACMPTQLWKDVYGYDVPEDSLWYFSAVGPGPGSDHGVDVVAPAAAVSTIPSWEGRNAYDLLEGSSVAVPHVAASAALLIEIVRSQGRNVSPFLIASAIRNGAVSLSGYTAAEQGTGAVNVYRSYEWLLAVGYHLPTRQELNWTIDGVEANQQGIYARGELTTNLSLSVRSPWNQQRLKFETSAAWLKSDRVNLRLSGRVTRQVHVTAHPPRVPGLYVGSITGLAPSLSGVILDATVAVPHNFDGSWLQLTGTLSPARYKREFLAVPTASRSLSLRLTVPVVGAAQGRVRMHVFDPDGDEVYLSPFVGAPDKSNLTIHNVITDPEPGVWEIVVYSSAALSSYGLTSSQYLLEAKADYISIVQPKYGVVQAHQPAGAWSQQFEIENRGSSVFVEPVFVTDSESPPISNWERPMLYRYGSVTRILTDVAGDTQLLQVTVKNPDDGLTDLDLYVYWQDPTTRTYHEVASSARRNQLTETVEIDKPQPGRYVVYVDAPAQQPDAVSFDLVALIVPRSDISISPRLPRFMTSGQSWTLEINKDRAPVHGDNTYLIGLRDSIEGRIVAQLPLRLDTRSKQLTVSVFPTILTPTAASVSITILERGSNKPVDRLIINVNGRAYTVRQGQVNVPVTDADSTSMVIVIDDPRYRFWFGRIELNRTKESLHNDYAPSVEPLLRQRVRHHL